MMLSRVWRSKVSPRGTWRSFAAAPSSAAHNDSQTQRHDRPFDKILVANRGEIVERIFRTCHTLDIETVAVTSTVDRRAPYAQMATAAESPIVCLGPPDAHDSYLHMDKVLEAVQISGAQAVHPGYGFLSENAVFAQRVVDAGIAWLGPPPAVVAIMGDKLASKAAAEQAGLPTVPGTAGIVESLSEALQIAEHDIGYPVLLKALAGGGGKGMRICQTPQQLTDAWDVSRAEAQQFFGNPDLLLEKYIDRPHHIEFQVLCGRKNSKSENDHHIVVFPERECSIQRRNQKIVEESPSVLLTPETRERMAQTVRKLCAQTGYESAGTVEFLVDPDQNFYFLEMNSRLQVEHPVTEAITGVDLVQGMLHVGAGWELPPQFGTVENQHEHAVLPYQGHSMEARIYAEDATRGFVPSTGVLAPYREPTANNIRVDSGVRRGQNITAHYDPMLSKVVSYGDTRIEAMDKLGTALDEYVIHGLQHNARLVRNILREPHFRQGETPTTYLDLHYPNMREQLTELQLQLTELECAELAAAAALYQSWRTTARQEPALPGANANANAVVVRLGGLSGLAYQCEWNNMDGNDPNTVTIRVLNDDDANSGNTHTLQVDAFDSIPEHHCVQISLNGVPRTIQVLPTPDQDGGGMLLQMYGAQSWTLVQSPREYELSQHMQHDWKRASSSAEISAGGRIVTTPMPGTLVRYSVQPGDWVEVGQELCIVEAMKMQNQITSTRTGTIQVCSVQAGDSLRADQVVLEFCEDDDDDAAAEN